MTTPEFSRGREEGQKHAAATTENWIRPTIGPLVWIGIPLFTTYIYVTRGGFSGFGYAARRAVATAMGQKPPPAPASATADAANPMAGMMEMMMPIQKRQFRVDVKGTKFTDVIGIPEAKADVQQYVDFLKDPKRFMRLGARLPRGCLLTGEPGTGKTLLAKAVAGEANVPFFSCSGADFVEIVAGSGPKRVRELFAEARAASPSIVFVDEIDAIGSRGGGSQKGGGMSSEENRTINQLLAELDGLSTGADTIIVMAATNFADNIDKALLREGRFDRKVDVEMPDLAARRELFKYYLDKVVTGDAAGAQPAQFAAAAATGSTTTIVAAVAAAPSSSEAVSNVELARRLADLTPGISPATVATIVNEAALQCGIEGAPRITFEALCGGVDNVLVGKKHRQRMGDEALRRTAIHEAGHAVVGWMLPPQKDVLKVSVVPRGNAAGYTQRAGSEYHEYQTNVTLFTDLVMMMGGRAAEEEIIGNSSVGAMDDVQRATDVAMRKLMAFGMSRSVGLLAYQPDENSKGREFGHFSEATQIRVEQAAKAMVGAAYEYAKELVREHKSKITALEARLMERKEVLQPELVELWGPRPAQPTSAELCARVDKLEL